MKNIIEELWYGNIQPLERSIRGDSEYDKLRRELSEKLDSFLPALSEEMRNRFEEITDVIWDMGALGQTDAFVHGFRLGARFVMDVTGEYKGQFEAR